MHCWSRHEERLGNHPNAHPLWKQCRVACAPVMIFGFGMNPFLTSAQSGFTTATSYTNIQKIRAHNKNTTSSRKRMFLKPKMRRNRTSAAVMRTPPHRGRPNSRYKAVADPMTYAKSVATMEISAITHKG